jgi:hypothetical protein
MLVEVGEKKYIVVVLENVYRWVCTSDVHRLYYLKKKSTPPIPTYDDPGPSDHCVSELANST